MQDAVTVGEVEVFVFHSGDFVVSEHVRPVEHLVRFGAVGAGVHVDGAADGAWDAGCELQAGEAAAGGGVGEHGVEDSRVGGDGCAFDLDVRQGFCKPDGETPDAAVADEHVRAAAQDRYRNVVFAGLLCG